MKYKHSIGTKIRFVHTVDKGLMGRIVGYQGHYTFVYLPKSTYNNINYRDTFTKDGTRYTWMCKDEDFEVLKNQQLLFNFMY